MLFHITESKITDFCASKLITETVGSVIKILDKALKVSGKYVNETIEKMTVVITVSKQAEK